jgi:hypothetical protein
MKPRFLLPYPLSHPIRCIMHIDGPTWSVSCEGPTAVICTQTSTAFDLQIDFVDARGNDADVLGNVAWVSNDSDTVRVEADVPGFQALVTAGARSGKAIINATAEADIGLGAETVVFDLVVEVEDHAE